MRTGGDNRPGRGMTAHPHPFRPGAIMPNPDPHPIDAAEQPTARPRTAAEDKLWAALSAHPATPAAELATAAGIGRSTAAKILARWATSNLVTRAAATTTAA